MIAYGARILVSHTRTVSVITRGVSRGTSPDITSLECHTTRGGGRPDFVEKNTDVATTPTCHDLTRITRTERFDSSELLLSHRGSKRGALAEGAED